MKIGDTFVWCPNRMGIAHLYILISDPDQNGGHCVVINLTESRHGQPSFVLKPGQHRFIRKDSDVNFGDAFSTEKTRLEEEIAKGLAEPHDPMDSVIVQAIIREAKTHPAFQPILRRLLP